MRVLIACEFSGIVRDAFVRAGHDAMSCDLLACETERPDGWDGHYQGDIRELLSDPSYSFDVMIAHPPCQYLNHAGVRWLYKGGRRWNKDGSENPRDPQRWKAMQDAAEFFLAMLNAPIPRIAVENSEMHPYALEIVKRKADQVIQPWEFGHGEVKATHIWLKNLPPLLATQIVAGRTPRVHHASPGKNRWKERSRTLPGIADAMAKQWGRLA